MRLFEDHSIFSPGKVWWDCLIELNPRQPLVKQKMLVGNREPFAVRYPNNVFLDVTASWNGSVEIFVSVVPHHETKPWTPVVKKKCNDLDELKRAILELALIARSWKN